MKRVLIIPAILATAFTAVIAEGQTDSAAQVTDMQILAQIKPEDVLFMDQNELKISDDSSIKFSNLYGYKSITDAEQEKNGQVIGLICACSSCPVDVSICYERKFVFYKEECAKERWIVREGYSNAELELVFLEKGAKGFKLEIVEDIYWKTTLEYVFSGYHGFDRYGVKGSQSNFVEQLEVVAHFIPRRFTFPFWCVDNSNSLCVEFAKDLAKKLSSKDSFSNAEKVAIYIAVEIIVDAYRG